MERESQGELYGSQKLVDWKGNSSLSSWTMECALALALALRAPASVSSEPEADPPCSTSEEFTFEFTFRFACGLPSSVEVAPGDASTPWRPSCDRFLLNRGGALRPLFTWLCRLATDLSMAARLGRVFRMPLGSFFLLVSSGGGAGGGARAETGRSEEAGGRWAGTN